MIAPLYCCDEYKVDSDGFIISKRDGTRMKPSKTRRGYLATTLMIDGKRKTMSIHNAVAKTFLGDKSLDGLVVNHKDGNKENNKVDNLEWVSRSYNTFHAAQILGKWTGRNNYRARAIRGYDKNTGELIYSFDSIVDCAKALCENNKYRHVQSCIWRALSGKRKTYKGCVWEYSN